MKLNRRSFVKHSALVTAGSLASRTLGLPLAFIVRPSPRGQDHPFFAGVNGLEVIAHRGGTGHWPGNTIYAMSEAIKAGADILEMDVYLTGDSNPKDRRLVLMHDRDVAMTTEGTGAVDRLPWETVRNLNAAHRWLPGHPENSRHRLGEKDLVKRFEVKVPELREVFEKFRQTRMVIEMKWKFAPLKPVRSPVRDLVKLIREYEMQNRVLVASFSNHFIDQFRAALPTVATSVSISVDDMYQTLRQIVSPRDLVSGPVALQLPRQAFHSSKLRPIIKALQSQFAIHPWTVNDPTEMIRMRSDPDFRVDGIITDYPCTLLQQLERRPPVAEPCRP